MIGKNVLRLNDATMRAALERYLAAEVFRAPYVVASIRTEWDSAGESWVFVVELDEPEDRCRMVCPHGDRCTLAAGHERETSPGTTIPVGCNHRGCDCNEPNAPMAVQDGGAQAILTPPVTYEVRS